MGECRSDDVFWKSVLTCTFVPHHELVTQEMNMTCQDWPLKYNLDNSNLCRNDGGFWKSVLTCIFVMQDKPITQEKKIDLSRLAIEAFYMYYSIILITRTVR